MNAKPYWTPRVNWPCTIAARMMKCAPDELPREIIDTLTDLVDACAVIGWEFRSQETIALVVHSWNEQILTGGGDA